MTRSDQASQETLILLAVVVVIALVGMVAVLNKTPGLRSITGMQSSTDTGTTLLQINQLSSLRFAVDVVNFGNGTVNTTGGNDRCILDTKGTNSLTRCINFTSNTAGFQIENDGTVNLTVQLAFSNDADGFLGGTSSINEYRYNVTQNETSSCRNSTGGTGGTTVTPIGWSDVNTTAPGTTICPKLLFTDLTDSIRVDINITIPNDAPSGVKTSTLTATATTVT